MSKPKPECEHSNLPWSLIDRFDDDVASPMGAPPIVVKRGECDLCKEQIDLVYGPPDHPESVFLPEEDEEVQALFAMSVADQEKVKTIAAVQREQYVKALLGPK